jgi:hypothetical protein
MTRLQCWFKVSETKAKEMEAKGFKIKFTRGAWRVLCHPSLLFEGKPA